MKNKKFNTYCDLLTDNKINYIKSLYTDVELSYESDVDIYKDFIIFKNINAKEYVIIFKGEDYNNALIKNKDIKKYLERFNVILIDHYYSDHLVKNLDFGELLPYIKDIEISHIHFSMHGARSYTSLDTQVDDRKVNEILKPIIKNLPNKPLNIYIDSCNGQVSINTLYNVVPEGTKIVADGENHYFNNFYYTLSSSGSIIAYWDTSEDLDYFKEVSKIYTPYKTNYSNVISEDFYNSFGYEPFVFYSYYYNSATYAIAGKCKPRSITTLKSEEIQSVFDAVSKDTLTTEITDYICKPLIQEYFLSLYTSINFDRKKAIDLVWDICKNNIIVGLEALKYDLITSTYPVLNARGDLGKYRNALFNEISEYFHEERNVLGSDKPKEDYFFHIINAIYLLYGPCTQNSHNLIEDCVDCFESYNYDNKICHIIASFLGPDSADYTGFC